MLKSGRPFYKENSNKANVCVLCVCGTSQNMGYVHYFGINTISFIYGVLYPSILE